MENNQTPVTPGNEPAGGTPDTHTDTFQSLMAQAEALISGDHTEASSPLPEETADPVPPQDHQEMVPSEKEQLSGPEVVDNLHTSPIPQVMPSLSGQEDEEPAPEEPVRKRRPAPRAGYGFLGIPHILSTAVWLLLVVAIGVSLGRLAWVCAADVLAFGREDHVVTITIAPDDDLEAIAAKLKQGGLIRYPKLFLEYAKLAKVEEKGKISTGTFTLNTLYDYHALVNAMGTYSDAREEVEVMIPEGYSCRQIFNLLEENNVCSAQALREYAADGELDDYWFLEGVERGSEYCLEGFLFPDTYQFYTNDEPRRVLEKLLDNFSYRFDEDMREQIVTLNERMAEKMRWNGYDEDYIEEHYFDIRKIVTIASLIEKESAGVLESYTISSVFYNRLTDLQNYPYLNSDAALYYALGGASNHELTAEDLQLDSPYNTYTHMGLIPGPIANPGRNSLYAALDPDDTDYHYFIYNKEEGAHHFSETLAEHEAYAATLGND
ncbi:MAG: endolytic transglycosylase MltG [Firmicutes bacterium]|nr:endolytic transglycosylase MltG [Bacillota bacterium]